MRKIFSLVLVVMFLGSIVFATMVDTRVSGNAVSFSTVTLGWLTTPNVVTFNSVTRHLTITNTSYVSNCWVDLRCVDSTGKSGYMTNLSPQLLVPTNSTVQIEFATSNLGFKGDIDQISTNGAVTGSNQIVVYTATGDVKDL